MSRSRKAKKPPFLEQLMNVVGNDISKSKKGATSEESLKPLHALYYYLILLLVKMISLMPFWLLYVISDVLFYPVYYILRYRRKVVHKNLTESFPEKSPEDIIKIEKGFYHFLIDLIFESCKLASIKPQEMKRRMKFINMELLNDMIEEGKSITVYVGHYGNWEWLASSGLWLNKKARSGQIYHQLNNKAIDKIMRDLRERMGNVCIDMNKTVQYIAEAKRADQQLIIGFIADQSPRRNASKNFEKFLNHMVPVLTGTEKVTKHFGYEATFFGVRRIKRGYYECVVSSLHDDPGSLPDFQLTSLYYQKLEQEILEQPECYLWSHKRFRYARKLDS